MISQWVLVMLVSGFYISPGDEVYKTETDCLAALAKFMRPMKQCEIEARKPHCVMQTYQAIKPQVIEQYPGQYGPRR